MKIGFLHAGTDFCPLVKESLVAKRAIIGSTIAHVSLGSLVAAPPLRIVEEELQIENELVEPKS